VVYRSGEEKPLSKSTQEGRVYFAYWQIKVPVRNMVALGLGFFLAAMGYAHACERL
jgi:hypothetical protein